MSDIRSKSLGDVSLRIFPVDLGLKTSWDYLKMVSN